MGIVRRFLKWLDSMLAPKATREEFERQVSGLVELHKQLMAGVKSHQDAIETLTLHVTKSENDCLKLRDELTAVKALLRIGGQKPENPPRQKFDGSEPWKR